ncbi:hypothetical protein TNIN_458701 [Trichonephila inaurata madagascariensis]|uniref:Uncharacterized protein n=1 Tax=Trichonephila inaurata madagascariensis TaxID=2747483 RepID=A0A8X6XK77_9ARAC|nr:hypothetical protein TNIN_458701 [Trichonephila inaurata madagascariensis]
MSPFIIPSSSFDPSGSEQDKFWNIRALALRRPNDVVWNEQQGKEKEHIGKKAEKLAKLEEKYETLHDTFKIAEKRLVEKESECASLKEKLLIVSTRMESNDHPKTSMSTKE